MTDLALLKSFLDKEKANKLALAAALGYSSTAPIEQWVARKRLPKFRRSEILRCIDEITIKPNKRKNIR